MEIVRLVCASQPRLPEFPNMMAQELVAYCARVSNPANQSNMGTGPKLVKYLVKNKHWSPLEMVSLTMEINTTRDIARQILRHRSFSFQEFSQRYADPTKDLEFRTKECRLQDDKNRQNSTPTQDKKLIDEWEARQKGAILRAQTTYEWAIKHGIAKEQARAILPEGCTMSRLYMAGTLRSWLHYCDLRRGNGTQKEHREVAEACWGIITQEYPIIADIME